MFLLIAILTLYLRERLFNTCYQPKRVIAQSSVPNCIMYHAFKKSESMQVDVSASVLREVRTGV